MNLLTQFFELLFYLFHPGSFVECYISIKMTKIGMEIRIASKIATHITPKPPENIILDPFPEVTITSSG